VRRPIWPPCWWKCPQCGADRTVERVEITTYGDVGPKYIDGAPHECEQCGSTLYPIKVQGAPSMAPTPYGPLVPTPDDILRGAGILIL
jgi:predicted nucleic-acid-binding Zn-ribbon protein